jgi:hypothetical protein
MFIRFREQTARRYGDGVRECVGKCKDRPRHYARYGVGVYVKGRTFVKGCPMKPLCPLAQPRRRLEVSIIETCREGGKVRQRHVASLGTLWSDTPADRERFWIECEARLERLSNRLGPDLDRLRQAIAARIPPITDADRAAMDAAAWDWLEGFWDRHAKDKARAAVRTIEEAREWAKEEQREAVEAELRTRQAQRLRGDWKAYDALNRLLGMALSPARSRVDHEEEKRLKAEISKYERHPGGG